MKYFTFTIATLLVAAIACVSAANDTIEEPDQEICILSIVPCPKKCQTTCIYPDLPCPKTHPPHCPNQKPKNWPPHQKRADSAANNNATAVNNEKASCLERPCPRVIFKPCPKECPTSCEFQNPLDPCCPYSGKPVCMISH